MLHFQPFDLPEGAAQPEPFFVAQTDQPEHTASAAAAMTWWGQQMELAMARCASQRLWPRFSWTPDGTQPPGLLIEVWDQMPDDEGAQRWALQKAG